jgi:predicted esterase
MFVRSAHRWTAVRFGAIALFIATLASGASDFAAADRVEMLPRSDGARRALWMRSETAKSPPILAYLPERLYTRGPLVLLHGMCDVPEAECPAFGGNASADRLLLCPRADVACEGGGATWSGTTKRRSELAIGALDRAGRTFPAYRTNDAATLIGFSLGAFAALDVAQNSQGRFRHLVLIAGRVEPDPVRLEKAGIDGVLLAAGERDMTRAHLGAVADRLKRRGVRSRFMSLGDVGHTFAPDMNAWLESALQWLENRPNA